MDIKAFRIYFIAALFLTAALALGGFLYFLGKNSSEISPGIPASKILEAEPPKTSDLAAGPPSEAELLFIGDIMMDRWIRQVGEKNGYGFVFQNVDNLLESNDLAIGNLEGPITDNKSVSIGSEFESRNNYIFTFDPKTAQVLRDHNINLVNLGNNHILNFGEKGLEQTKNCLKDSGVDYFCAEDPRSRVYDLRGIKIGFVCYNQFENDAYEKTIGEIGEMRKKSDVVILYAHWGKEYETSILPIIRMLGHKFIDSGADLIIGSHPHVVQEKEEYKGKIIYYSLGNFIFDQYFDQNTTKGLAVKATIGSDNSISLQEFNVEMKNNGQTEVIGN